MNEQEYIDRLKKENRLLQDKLDKINSGKQKKRRFRWWLLKKSGVPIFGSRLKKSIGNAINEYKEYKTVSVDTVSDVSSSVIWRITRIGLFAFMVGIIPAAVLVFQTKLLINQNKFIENQNNLVEADRRSSLVFVMDNVLGDLNEELKYKGVNSKNNISKTLEARIISLSRAMKPYQYIEDGKLTNEKTSSERGQLLYSLINSDLGEQSLSDIFLGGNFEYSDLKEIPLGREVYLKYAKLNYSNLANANMPAANLVSSELRNVNMNKINLSDADLKRAKLISCNLKDAELAGADLTNANLSGADLSGADLSGAILWGTKLIDTNLSDVVLDNAIVDKQDWIDYITDSLELEGSEEVEDRYKIKKQGKKQFILIPKKKS